MKRVKSFVFKREYFDACRSANIPQEAAAALYDLVEGIFYPNQPPREGFSDSAVAANAALGAIIWEGIRRRKRKKKRRNRSSR